MDTHGTLVEDMVFVNGQMIPEAKLEEEQIWLIFVKQNIRREGIGSILIEYSKKKFKKFFVSVDNFSCGKVFFVYFTH